MIEARQTTELGEVADAGPAVSEISVKIDAGGAHAFFIVLAADGTIRRRRGGASEGPDQDMVIGAADPGLFETIRSLITPQLLKWCRPLRTPALSSSGLRELEVRLKQADGEELLSRWQVEAGSSGPPSPVIEFAAAAVEATNRWYEEQKATVARGPRRSGRTGWHLVS
jgi:hypothetical protein